MQAPCAYQRLTYSGFEPTQAFDIVYGGQFEHRLLSAQQSTMEHQRLLLEDLRLETGHYDFPVIACGAMPRDMVCIGLVADGIETTRYNTAAIGSDEIQVYPQGVDLLYHAAAASRWISFAVPEARLQQVAIARTGRPLTLPKRDAASVRLTLGGRRRLAQLADDALAIGHVLQQPGMSSTLATAIADGLVASYVEALCGAESGTGIRRRTSTSARQHLHLVLACERLAMSADELDIRLEDIARRSGYSRRSLELIFKRSVGMPPGRWFINMRLNGALRDLLTPNPQRRVADVATRWGFHHLPRFADQYRRAFGELPSETLNRARL